ncbi:hypothetical protein RBXJA2T_07748 [Rubrivivax benzoatilyticus JA2 = ATCC BAA-35]|nr:hypothetical protein RBXJA2T_07748 [Rubrivivax benzoatilyticus JA2 = ATCC BAA-35]
MLYAINGGRVEGCAWRQADIVHFETTVENVTALGQPFVFYDRNATLAFSAAYTDLAQLDTVVAWDLITERPQLDGYCRFWHTIQASERYAERMERRQAEFLVKDHTPLNCMTRIGVIDAERQALVQGLVAQAGLPLRVDVMPDWYF